MPRLLSPSGCKASVPLLEETVYAPEPIWTGA